MPLMFHETNPMGCFIILIISWNFCNSSNPQGPLGTFAWRWRRRSLIHPSFMVTVALAQHKSSLVLIRTIQCLLFSSFSQAIFPGFPRFPLFFPPRPRVLTNVSSTKKPSLSGSTTWAEFNLRAKSSRYVAHSPDYVATHSKGHDALTESIHW